MTAEAPRRLRPHGPGVASQAPVRPAAPHLRREDGSLFPGAERHTFRLCWWMIESRVIQEKCVGMLTAALQPVFHLLGD